MLGKSSSTGTQKLSLCFLEDTMYSKWMEVFDAWELEKLIGEDGKKPENIPKVPRLDITIKDVVQIIGFRDSELFMLAKATLAN
jgi:hypothetical protein